MRTLKLFDDWDKLVGTEYATQEEYETAGGCTLGSILR